MITNLDKFKNDIKRLEKTGNTMNLDIEAQYLEENSALEGKLKTVYEKIKGKFYNEYQKWYTEAYVLIKQILPQRLEEFEDLYRGEKKRKNNHHSNFSIQDWLNGCRSNINQFTGEKHYNDIGLIGMKFKTQLKILSASNVRFESSLFEIRQLLQADLFDTELDTAKELLKKGFLRGAGAISGVVLENHLSEICGNHKLSIRKKNPSISDYNDLLKNNDIIDIPTWRFIQRLGDLRNLCDHNKDREPTKEEVSELIQGTEKITKTVY